MKKRFVIKITEILERNVVVYADSSEDAKDIVEEEYGQTNIVLDYNDFTGVDFSVNHKYGDSSKLEVIESNL